MGDIAHVSLPEEGEGVVLAQREEVDRPFHHLADVAVVAAALGLEDLEQLGVAVVALRGFEQGADKAPRRIVRGWRVQVHAEGGKDLGHIALEFFELRPGYLARVNVELVVYILFGFKQVGHACLDRICDNQSIPGFNYLPEYKISARRVLCEGY